MKMTPLRKLLKDEKKCNPFNDAFDGDVMWKLIQQSMPFEEFQQDSLHDTPAVAVFMNGFFKDFFALLKEGLSKANQQHKEFIELLIVLFNRNYLVVIKKQIELMSKQTQINQNDLYKMKLSTLNEGMGPVEINSSLEVEIDALTYVLNYTRYFATISITIDSSLPELHPIQIGQAIFLNSSYYTIIKSTYDDSIWIYGHWNTRTENSKTIFEVIYPASDLLVINKVGLIRMQKNATSSVLQLLPDIINQSPLGKILSQVARSRKKTKHLASVRIINGYVQPVLAEGFSDEQDFYEIKNITEFDTFYAFLGTPTLKNLQDLQLLDLIKLFTLLQNLCRRAALTEFDDSIIKYDDIKKFPAKIDRQELITYFASCTDYSTTQIEIFVDLVCTKYGDRITLWECPMIGIDQDIYINYFPTLHPLLLNMIDYWLDKGGFSFDERGDLLEAYLRKVTHAALMEKGFEGKIPSAGKIYNRSKQFEEIDLLINLKDIVVIAEVKCIKYPYDTRNHHNALNRLNQAAEQVKRKMAFLKNNESEVIGQTGSLAGKTFLPIIVTNYPIYSTFKLDGIIITDFYLLESYFAEGVFTDARMNKEGELEIINKNSYYSDEKQFNANLADYLKNAPGVTTLKDIFEVRPFRVSMDDLDYEIYVTSAQTKIDPNLIISHKAKEN